MGGYLILFENKQMRLVPGRSYLIGRDEECDITLESTCVSRRHARLECAESGFVLTDLESTNGTWVEGERITRSIRQTGFTFRAADCNLAIKEAAEGVKPAKPSSGETMVFETKLAGILEKVEDDTLQQQIGELRQLYNKKKENLEEMAFRDPLTRLYNRRWFDKKLHEEVSRAVRYGRPLALIMFDIDHFKKFNDTYGHQKGDEVLAAVAAVIRETVRESDIACRYGGEELAVILPETTGEQGGLAAEACRGRIQELSASRAGVTVTVSAGVSGLTQGVSTPAQLIKNADRALYRAKETGRNKAVCHTGS